MRLLFRVLGVGFVGAAIMVACGGSDFSSNGTPSKPGVGGASAAAGTGGNGGSLSGAGGDTSLAGTAGDFAAGAPGSGGTSAGSAGSAGTAGGGTTLCTGAKDCDDGDPCTVDTCGADGVCERAQKCTGDQPLCCDGECGQCCSKSDCDDQVDCTDDECFAGFCTNTPGTCASNTDYCSPTGCVPREDCKVDADCADDDPCTTDSCVNHLCSHPSCPAGGSCCPGLGCGTCCSDSQCPHDDPCSPSTCGTDLKCQVGSLCGSADRCCPSSDGKTAACGTCCEAADCPDDGVVCTVESCKATSDGSLACSSTPDATLCMPGQTCDPKRDCVSDQCKEAGDCSDPLACKQVACNNGSCDYTDVSCSHGQKCCPTDGTCKTCCSNNDCHDTSAALCCAATGTCAQCCADSDCLTASPGGGATPQALVGGGTTTCSRPYCDAGTCKVQTDSCPADEKCCQGTGCIPALKTCGVMTN